MMADEEPKSRPEPAPEKPTRAAPNVYGGQWGQSGKQNDGQPVGQTDRPDKIETPNDEKPGAGEEGGPRAGG